MTTTQKKLLKAEQALAAAEAEVKKLREQLASEVNPARLFYPKKGEALYCLMPTLPIGIGAFRATGLYRTEYDWQLPAFRNQEHAEAMAHALNVSFLLRAQPGVVEATDEEENQYHIVAKVGGGLTVEDWHTAAYKYSEFSPCFDSEQSARAAIKAVGSRRLLRL
jgi:hypothetical protein